MRARYMQEGCWARRHQTKLIPFFAMQMRLIAHQLAAPGVVNAALRAASCEWHHTRQPSSHRRVRTVAYLSSVKEILLAQQQQRGAGTHTELNTQSNCHSLLTRHCCRCVIPQREQSPLVCICKGGSTPQPARSKVSLARTNLALLIYVLCFIPDRHPHFVAFVNQEFFRPYGMRGECAEL